MARVKRVTIDEKFNDEYDRKGMQPFVSKDGRIRNVQMEKKNKQTFGNTKQIAGERSQRVGTHFGGQAANDSNYGGAQVTRIASNRAISPRARTGNGKANQVTNAQKRQKSTAFARIRVTATNTSIMAWAIPLWLTFQIPMAIFHLMLFGIAGAFSVITVEASETDSTAASVVKFFGRIIKTAFSTINDFIASVFGVDILAFFAKFAPSNIFMLFQIILTMYGFAVLMAIGFIYLFARLKPLSGEGTTLKFSAVIISLVGYMFPFLSLFPWFLVWTTAVWLKPK